MLYFHGLAILSEWPSVGESGVGDQCQSLRRITAARHAREDAGGPETAFRERRTTANVSREDCGRGRGQHIGRQQEVACA